MHNAHIFIYLLLLYFKLFRIVNYPFKFEYNHYIHTFSYITYIYYVLYVLN